MMGPLNAVLLGGWLQEVVECEHRSNNRGKRNQQFEVCNQKNETLKKLMVPGYRLDKKSYAISIY
jgi:hypothetical protein